jgi:hypothetical protein
MGTTAGAAVRCVGVGGRDAGIATHRRALRFYGGTSTV